jgi:4-amino-4-deoxy-L-arabinose transferase-like glycosyltransferase
MARTGDHDALLILFVTGIVLIFYRYLITDKPRPHLLMGIALLFIMGVYTKSIAVFFAIPGLFFSLFAFHSWKKLFSDKWFYIALACFIVSIGAYYAIRENIQPGYLNAVWQWELLPRYANTEDRFDSGTFWYYAINFYQSRFSWWIGFLVFAVIALPFMLKNEKRRFFFYILMNTVSLFLILSAGSKHLWYDGPLYPLFAIIISLFLNQIIRIILRDHSPQKLIYRIGRIMFIIVFIIMIFYFPYQSIIRKISREQVHNWDSETYSMSYILRDQQSLESLPDPLRIVFEGYDAHLLFYVEAENFRQNRERQPCLKF